MELAEFLNLAGLALITMGSICAANSAPTTSYGPDGSVSIAGPEMKGDAGRSKRIAMHKRQKRFPQFLWTIAAGAILQAAAVLLPHLSF